MKRHHQPSGLQRGLELLIDRKDSSNNNLDNYIWTC